MTAKEVDILLSAGLERRAAQGYDYCWIHRSVFYRLSLADQPNLQVARNVAASVTPLSLNQAWENEGVTNHYVYSPISGQLWANMSCYCYNGCSGSPCSGGCVQHFINSQYGWAAPWDVGGGGVQAGVLSENLVTSFAYGFAVNGARGDTNVPCGCFGSRHDDPIGIATLLRQGVLLGLSLLTTWLEHADRQKRFARGERRLARPTPRHRQVGLLGIAAGRRPDAPRADRRV